MPYVTPWSKGEMMVKVDPLSTWKEAQCPELRLDGVSIRYESFAYVQKSLSMFEKYIFFYLS